MNNDSYCWHTLHITDKTGAKFFNTTASPMSAASELRNMQRHLVAIKAQDKAYAAIMCDPFTAVIMLDGIPYMPLDDLLSDDDLLALLEE